MRRTSLSQREREHRSRPRSSLAKGSSLTALSCAVLAVGVGAPARALEGPHNELPQICQGVNGAAYSASEIASYVTPPPFDLGFTAGAFAGNWALRLCPPQILAPPDQYLEADSTSATSNDPEVVNPRQNDPACYATVRQSITKEQYENFLGIPFKMPQWGALGTPQVYHFNTSVDVRLWNGQALDDPSTPGNEALIDELPLLRNAAGQTILKLPVGRNSLTYRADTLVSPLDFLFLYLPKLPAGSKPFRALAGESEKISQAAVRAYRALDNAVEVITSPVGTLALEKTIVKDTFRHSQLRVIDDIYNQDSQRAWVYDRIPPVIRSSTAVDALPEHIRAVVGYDAATGTYYVEAIHPGGIKAQIGKDFMASLLSYHDHCDHRVDVQNNAAGGNFWGVGDTIDLEWTALDPGPTNETGGRNSARVVQRIQVRDTKPPVLLAPPSRVIEVPAGQTSVQVALGSPRVFDLAQLEPTVANNAASDTFNLGLSQVTWSASDGSNSSQAVQLINIKTAGTNRTPVANAQSVDTQSFKDTEIILSGTDADFHPSVNRHDPLAFEIVTPPEHGFFVAPLLPYFIDDYRLEASALKFTDQLRQTDPAGYCSTFRGRHDAANPSAWQMGYPYRPYWISVDDDGNSIVYDQGDMRCDNNGSSTSTARLAVFNAEQDVVATRGLPTGVFIEDLFWHLGSGSIYVTWSDNQGDDFVVVYDSGLVERVRYNVTRYTGSQQSTVVLRAKSAIADHRGILYVADSGAVGVKAYRQVDSGSNVSAASVYLGDAFVPNLGDLQSMAVDSSNNLYVGYNDRIFKVAAAQLDDDGVFTPGEVIGWSGRCSANLTNEYACDIDNGVSLGFSCTDALCARTQGVNGSRPGQFDQAKGIAVDPNDVLYVSDFGNSRIQRFTPDGFFAGQARSQGIGYGFLLGDFGQPADIEVNSNHFYVLNRDNDLLHIFETTPITPLDDARAKVVYRSNNNYVGTDQFRFSASDGLASGEATVTLNVSRNFRAPSIPNASEPLTIAPTPEDTAVTFALNGSDPDGSLDTLSVVVVEPPKNGTLSFNGLTTTYTPTQNFSGTDAFVYRISDGREPSAEAVRVELTIDEVEDSPTVVAAADGTASLGFRFAHRLDVFDPDPNETLLVTIDWGDGTQVTDGHFALNGQPLTWQQATNEDGTIRDGVTRTGPILGLDPTGRGVIMDDHVYATSGTYDISSCVHDKALLNETTQTKSLTGASKQACSTTRIVVSASAELSIDIVAPQDDVAPASSQVFRASVRNRTFDAPVSAPGTDVLGLEVSGELPQGLALTAVRAAGVCTSGAQTFTCAVPQLRYGTETTFEIDVRVAAQAPGGAELALVMDGEWTGMREKATSAAAVTVAQSNDPPVLSEVAPEFGDPQGFNEVTLSGSRFASGARVRFGARYGTNIRVIDSETIAVIAPAQLAGSVDVVVINPDDRESLLANAYRYGTAVEPPAPPSPPPAPPAPPPAATPSGGGGGGALEWPLLAFMSLILCARLRRRGILARSR